MGDFYFINLIQLRQGAHDRHGDDAEDGGDGDDQSCVDAVAVKFFGEHAGCRGGRGGCGDHQNRCGQLVVINTFALELFYLKGVEFFKNLCYH